MSSCKGREKDEKKTMSRILYYLDIEPVLLYSTSPPYLKEVKTQVVKS